MKKPFKNKIPNDIRESGGFTLVEILISLAISLIILLAVISSFFSMTNANNKTKAGREALDNARRAMDIITYEIKGSEGIYTPTTTENQLSLETQKYFTESENTTYIDFFICEQKICLKKEGQSPVSLTADSVQVESLSFAQILNNGKPSIKIDMAVRYNNTTGNPNNDASSTLSSTVSLRNY